jgi:hypothetical protein
LGYDAMLSGTQLPTFQKNLLPLPYYITSQKTVIFIFITVRTSNLSRQSGSALSVLMDNLSFLNLLEEDAEPCLHNINFINLDALQTSALQLQNLCTHVAESSTNLLTCGKKKY